MEAEITNKKTGEAGTFLLTPSFASRDDVNTYSFNVEYALGDASIDDIECSFYISLDGYEHYKIADLEHNLNED